MRCDSLLRCAAALTAILLACAAAAPASRSGRNRVSRGKRVYRRKKRRRRSSIESANGCILNPTGMLKMEIPGKLLGLPSLEETVVSSTANRR